MKQIISITLSALCLLPLVNGCASMGAHCEGPRPDPYAGFRGDAGAMIHPDNAGIFGLASLDLPFSFVWDTLCLPLDGTAAALKASYNAQSRHEHPVPDKKPPANPADSAVSAAPKITVEASSAAP